MTDRSGNWAALLTPPGVGAIAVIRIAGPDALRIIGELFQPVQRLRASKEAGAVLDSDALRYGRILIDGEVVDDVIACRVSTIDLPIVDLSTHGGVRVVERVLEAIEQRGARVTSADALPAVAWPADTLIEEEIVRAWSLAKTTRAVRFLAWQQRSLVAALMNTADLCETDCDAAAKAMRAMLGGFRAAQFLASEATVAIVGPPNSGKSTLFNRLVGRDATIVSQLAGTTRDWVEASIDVGGVPIRLIDTAGLHDEAGDLEEQAIEAGRRAAATADLTVIVFDGSQPRPDGSGSFTSMLSTAACLTVWNKSDLPRSPNEAGDARVEVAVSARTGDGVESLTTAMLKCLGFDEFQDAAPTFFTGRQARVSRAVLATVTSAPGDAARAIREELIGPAAGSV